MQQVLELEEALQKVNLMELDDFKCDFEIIEDNEADLEGKFISEIK